MPQKEPRPDVSRRPLHALAVPAAVLVAAMFLLPAPASAASVAPPARIATAGTINFCSDMTGPPLEYLDPSTKPIGSDIDIGNEIAKLFGVKAEWHNIPFKGLVPALLAKQCDAVISQLFDKPERRQVIDMVDYMDSSEALLVHAGNPKKIHSLDDLSGEKVAVENGTTIQDLITAQNKKFAAEGKKPAELIVFPKDTDALQALQIGQVDVYGTTLETGAYYMGKSPNTFEVAGPPFHRILTGIGMRKDDPGMQAAIQSAVDTMKKDGTLLAILKKWGLEGDMMK
jgi:polar amino acid transport system substrate-binding protein